MKRRPYIISVPHTGTRFCRQLFGPIYPLGVAPFMHVYSYAPALNRCRHEPGNVIVPIRHPDRLMSSWLRRAGSLHVINTLPNLLNNLTRLTASEPLWFFPIDHESRHDTLATLNDYFGFQFTTNWEPVGQSNPPIERSTAFDSMLDWELLPEQWRRIYG